MDLFFLFLVLDLQLLWKEELFLRLAQKVSFDYLNKLIDY